MGVVRGDKIGESARLNRRSPQARAFYAQMISNDKKVVDDFGRFRPAALQVTAAMCPRDEPTGKLFRYVKAMLKELGSGPDPLWYTWKVDGVEFGQMHAWKPRGKRYHRTPEPPEGSQAYDVLKHVHDIACASTAKHQAASWGMRDDAEKLGLLLKDFRDRKRPPKATPRRTPKVPPPSSPSSPEITERTTDSAGPSAGASEPPPTAATPDEARAKAVEVLGEPPHRPWSSEACDDWSEHLGSPKGGRIGHALKPHVNRYGWSVVRPLWRQACKEAAGWEDPQRFTPETFAGVFLAKLKASRGLIAPTRAGPHGAKSGTVNQRNIEALGNFMARRTTDAEGSGEGEAIRDVVDEARRLPAPGSRRGDP